MLFDNLAKSLVRPAPGSFPSIIQEVLALLEDVEANMFGVKTSRYSLVAKLQRLVQMPTKLIGIGLAAKLRWATTWAFITVAFFVINAWVSRPAVGLDPMVKEAMTWICIAVPIFLVLFPTPSAYALAGVSEPDIDFAMRNLFDRRLDTERRLATVRQHLTMLEVRCAARVQTHKWIVGIAWAIWTFFLLKGSDLALAGKLPLPESLLATAAGFYAVCAMYLLAAGYESALGRVFRSIEIACAELLLIRQEEAVKAGETPDSFNREEAAATSLKPSAINPDAASTTPAAAPTS
ncbi:hypothetical protein ACQ86G_28650 [Roseateles chitinivorans]|uniref:hypothetical protein n=1 Tax=Roseateles chitinivorans TaxID=2917965 RepID=UPI003D67C9C0